MAYTVETKYDSRIPSSPGNGTPFSLFACHDTEGGVGRAGALGTIQFLIDRRDRNASYHEIWWYEEASGDFGAIRIVPPHRAAHSVNPTPPTYSPSAWVKESLGKNYWDPNQGVYAVSIAGRVADVDRWSKDRRFLEAAHRRFKELQKELGISRRAEHFQFNPSTRSDWGKNLMTALGGQVIPAELPEATMNYTLMPIKPTLMTIRDGTSIRLRPDLSEASSPWVLRDRTATVTAIAEVQGQDFGAGPVWYAYVISTGNLRFFHSQDVLSKVVLIDPRTVDTSALQAKIDEQANRIATLMNENATLMEKVALLDRVRTAVRDLIK